MSVTQSVSELHVNAGALPDPIWEAYVLRRGTLQVEATWRTLCASTFPQKILFITGAGFDPRLTLAPTVLLRALGQSKSTIDCLMLHFQGYALDTDLIQKTEQHANFLRATFAGYPCDEQVIQVGASRPGVSGGRGDPGLSASWLTKRVLNNYRVHDYRHIVVDISSLPRIVYLTLLLHLLGAVVPAGNPRAKVLSTAPSLHVVVAEDPILDSKILSTELGHQITYVAGFSSARHQEKFASWPSVVIPILGEGRVEHLRKVLQNDDDKQRELCPVLPHPSRNPRRADNIVQQYADLLFETYLVESSAFIYADEKNPFEMYRQLRRVFLNYATCFRLVSGCRIHVVPLSSKLITVGAALACFEWHTSDDTHHWRIGIPYPEPSRYRIDTSAALVSTNAELTLALLSGPAYGT